MEKNQKKYICIDITESLCCTPETQYCKSTILQPKKGRDMRKMIFLCTMWGHSKRMSVCKPGRTPSPDTSQPDPWSWTSQPPELWEINVHCLRLKKQKNKRKKAHHHHHQQKPPDNLQSDSFREKNKTKQNKTKLGRDTLFFKETFS